MTIAPRWTNQISLTIDEFEQITMGVAAGVLDKKRLTELFEAAIRPLHKR